MLHNIAIISFIIDIFLILIFIYQIIKSGEFINKKSAIFLIPTFINIYLLYTVGILYTNERSLNALIYGVQYSVLTFAMRFNFDVIKEALEASTLYYVALYLGVGFAALTTVVVVIAFILGKFVNKIKTTFIMKNPIIIIGFNDDSMIFYNSIKSRSKYFIIENDENTIKYCLTNNIKYLISSDTIYTKFLKKNSNAHFISFLEDGFKEIKLIEKFKELNVSYSKYIFDLKVTASNENVSSYQAIACNHSRITIVSEAILVSKKCLLDHQITTYMSSKQIDYKTGTLRTETNINVFMIGFNAINQTLYKQSLISNQFVKLDKIYKSYVPSYYIFDSTNSTDNCDFNHTLKHIKEINYTDDYFPKCDEIEHTSYLNFGIDSPHFYETIYDKVKNSIDSSYNTFYIAYDNELLNIDIAIKLNQKLYEWNIKGNIKLFVYIKHKELKEVLEIKNLPNIIMFGTKEEIITYPILIEDFLDEYAKRRALYYELSNQKTNYNVEDILSKLEAHDTTLENKKNEIWASLNNYQKKSNISSVLSIFSKLNMIGLKVDADNGISEKEFIDYYDEFGVLKNQVITYEIRDGKPHLSKRNALAYMEHLRWNAFMISEGYVPMKKSDIKICTDNKKISLYKNDVSLRIHACITSYEGLEEYFDFMAKKIVSSSNKTYKEAFDMVENKKYDYMLMDTVYTDIKIMDRFIKFKND